MNTENKTWQSVKAQYINQVEKALSSVNHPRSEEIIDDVRSHLDRRFAELPADKQTWENFQAIITDMGPPSEYAELLDVGESPKTQSPSLKFIIPIAIILGAVAALMIGLPIYYHPEQKTHKLTEVSLPHPFVNDPQILGFWESVDLVKFIEQFQPGTKAWQGDLFLKKVNFLPNGLTSSFFTWTKDYIWRENGKTKAQYKIKKMAGQTYLFLPWLSGDVTIRGQKPAYYVLKKVVTEDAASQKTQSGIKPQALEAAITSAEQWLKLIDNENFAQSWDQAAEYFKSAVTKEQWQQSLNTVRAPLGKVISRQVKTKRYTKQLPGAPDGEYVVIQFDTSFENKKSAIETVTPMLDKDGQWRVSGYYVK